MTNKKLFLFLTVLSALFSSYCAYQLYLTSLPFQDNVSEYLLFLLYFGNGLIYGLFTFIAVVRVKKFNNGFIWLLGTTLSYIVGVWLPSIILRGGEYTTLSMGLLGFFGSIVLALTYQAICSNVRKLDLFATVPTVIAGTLSAAIPFQIFIWVANSSNILLIVSIILLIWPVIVTTVMLYTSK